MALDLARIDAHLLAHPGASKAFKPEWGWFCYWVGARQFACEFTVGPEHKPPYAGRHLLQLKCDPAWGAALREEYRDAVFPAFYSDKRTWIAIDLDKDVPEDLVLELCSQSYELVFAKLTKKLQREIAVASASG